MRFFTGLHQPSDAKHFDSAFISVNRLRKRKGPFQVGDWIMDSGAFTEISTHGHYRHSVSEYADQITFTVAALIDWLVFSKASGSWAARSMKSNVAGAAVDSLIFPTLAFGSLMPAIVLAQFVAKVAGGSLWTLAIARFQKVPA